MLLLALFSGIAEAQIFTDDLDSENNTNWTVLTTSEAESTFGFDYSVLGIPSAPHGTGTVGLKLEVNNNGTPGGTGSISDATLVNFNDDYTGQYTFQVDIWQNWTLDTSDPGGVNSPTTTEFAGAGVGHDALVAGLWGASIYYSGDGGSTRDYRLYKNLFEQFPQGGQYAIGDQAGDNDNTNPIFTDAWTGVDVDSATSNQQGETGVITPSGTTGFGWMTLKIEVDTDAVGVGITQDLGTVRFTLSSATFSNAIEIGTLQNSNGGTVVDFNTPGATRSIALQLSDFNSAVSLDPQFSFTLFDNVSVTQGIANPETADFNSDGDVDGGDFLTWQRGVGIDDGMATLENGDANRDGKVDSVDLIVWEQQLGSTNSNPETADFNSDGDVDSGDLLAWQRGIGIDDGTALLENGDANGDGNVDGVDLAIWKQQFGSTTPQSLISAVPEPTTALLMMLSGVAVAAVRRSQMPCGLVRSCQPGSHQ